MSTSVALFLAVILGSLVLVLLATGALLLIYRRTREGSYDVEMRQVDLEMFRRSTEARLYDLTREMTATEARWRDANHLLLSSQYATPSNPSAPVPLLPFLAEAGLTGSDLQVDRRKVFVLTPFHERFRDSFETIQRVCESLGLQAVRGDEEFAEDVFLNILRQLASARLVVANVDGRNPNVFYELGIANALGKSVILVSSVDTLAPFDISTRRTVFFHNQQDLYALLKEEVVKALI